MRRLLPTLGLVLFLLFGASVVVDIPQVDAACWCADPDGSSCKCGKTGTSPFTGNVGGIDVYCDTQEEANSYDAMKSPICGSSAEQVPWCAHSEDNNNFWMCYGGDFALGASNITVPKNGAVSEGSVSGSITWNGATFGNPGEDNHYFACADNVFCCGSDFCSQDGVPQRLSSCEPQRQSVVPPVGLCGLTSVIREEGEGESRLWFSQSRLVATLASIAQTLFNPYGLDFDHENDQVGIYNQSAFSKNTPVSNRSGTLSNQGAVTTRLERHQGEDDATQSVNKSDNNSSVIVGVHAPPALNPQRQESFVPTQNSSSSNQETGQARSSSTFELPDIGTDHDDPGYNGRIGGTIYDCDGVPINGIEVQMLSETGGKWSDVRDDTVSETIGGVDGQWRITLNAWHKNSGRKTFGLNVGKDTRPEKNYPYFTAISKKFTAASSRGKDADCDKIACGFKGGLVSGGPERDSYASHSDRWDDQEEFRRFFITDAKGDKVDGFALGFDFQMLADENGECAEIIAPPTNLPTPDPIDNNPYKDKSCYIPDTIDRAGDDLIGPRIKSELLFTEEFSFEPIPRPPGCIDDGGTYISPAGQLCNCCSQKCSRANNQCIVPNPLGGCIVPLPAGTEIISCDSPDQLTFTTEADIEIYDKTPLVEQIFNILLEGEDSLYRRFMPRLSTPIEEIPTSTDFTASVAGAGSVDVEYAGGQASSPKLYIPRLGSLDKYWLEDFQKSIRPQGFGRDRAPSEVGTTPPPSPSDGGSCQINCNQNVTDEEVRNAGGGKYLGAFKANVIDLANRWVATGGENNYATECYNDVVKRSLDAGINPGFSLMIWVEESGASNYNSNVTSCVTQDFGINVPSLAANFNAQITRFLTLPASYQATYGNCFDNGYTDMENFMHLYKSGPTTNVSGQCVPDNDSVSYHQKMENEVWPLFAPGCDFPDYPTDNSCP